MIDYETGSIIYTIDQLADCRIVEKYKELHERVLDEFHFSDVCYMDDQAEVLFARYFPGGIHVSSVL